MWKEPTGPSTYPKTKELNVVGDHIITEMWEDVLASKLHILLDAMGVKWTSTDVVRVGSREESSPPVILWIGVMPSSLSSQDGITTAFKCRELLNEPGISDIDVEIRESEATCSTGPKLLAPVHDFHPAARVRNPLTNTLGHPISAKSTPWIEGTSGFFVAQGDRHDNLFLVTARHVVFGTDKNNNDYFRHKKNGQPPQCITLFGERSLRECCDSIPMAIEDQRPVIEYRERQRITIVPVPYKPKSMKQTRLEAELEQARVRVQELEKFNHDFLTGWVSQEDRILGHVVLSPPIDVGVGRESFTEGWAAIEIDKSKIDESRFYFNAIDLGFDIDVPRFTRMMCPNAQNAHPFIYSHDRLLKIRGIISTGEMRCPTTLNQYDEPYIMVIKRGTTTGLTIGRANNIFSYTRKYFDDGTTQTSKE